MRTLGRGHSRSLSEIVSVVGLVRFNVASGFHVCLVGTFSFQILFS